MGMLKRKPKRPGKKGGQSLTSKGRIEAKQKATQAVELRKGGATYQSIADVLGYNSPQAAWEAVTRTLMETMREPADELRKLEVDRLDSLFLTVYPMAKQGILSAVDRCLRIMERRARLLGLDAPMIFDWRREAKEKGLPAADQFEQMVGMFYGQLREVEK